MFFVHVMKTGGTTLSRHLRSILEPEALYPNPSVDLRFVGARMDIRHHLSVSYLVGLDAERRAAIRVYTGHFPFAAVEMLGEPCTTMAILRDPVERTLSLLRQFRRPALAVQDPGRRPRLEAATLEEVYEDPAVFEPLVRNHQTKIFSMRPADGPESYLDVVEVDEDRLELAKVNVRRIDILGVTERYADFLDEVRRRLGWSVPPDARANVTPADDEEPASEALRSRIAIDNALDVALHQYAAELVEQRSTDSTAT